MHSLSTETYQALVEELNACKVEANFNLGLEAARWAHKMGEIIRSYAKGDITDLLPHVAAETGISERTLWRRVELYDKEHDFEKLVAPYGKDISIRKLLGTPQKEKQEDTAPCNHKCPHHCPSFIVK